MGRGRDRRALPVVADLTGDGLPDVATADAGADTVSLLRNTGAPAPSGTQGAAFAPAAVGAAGPAADDHDRQPRPAPHR